MGIFYDLIYGIHIDFKNLGVSSYCLTSLRLGPASYKNKSLNPKGNPLVYIEKLLKKSIRHLGDPKKY